jgi:flagellar hook-length control protein FliK
VVSLQPKLIFSISASSNPLSTQDQLSPTAKLLSSLMQQPMESRFVRTTQSAPPLMATQALLDPFDLAGKLQNAMGQSGLFYESHQAQWIDGGRSTQQLLTEPQNQLTLASSSTTQTLPGDAQNKSALTAAASAPSNTTAASAHQGTSVLSIPDPLQPLVQQQLNALETRQVLWQGKVWPEQEMRWSIQEDTPHNRGKGEPDPRWATEIELDLPHLGRVAATLHFGANGLSLNLSANEAETRQLFTASTAQLISALSDRGLQVIHTRVTSDEHAG